MFIQTEATPNPATLKFLPGQTVLEAGTADFPTAESSAKSPLASRIFAVQGVTGIFFGPADISADMGLMGKTMDPAVWNLIKQAAKKLNQKRGGGKMPISIDEELAEKRFQSEPADDLTPENLFDREWALALLQGVIERLRIDYEKQGKSEIFGVLGEFLTEKPDKGTYPKIAEQLGVSEGNVRVMVNRIRKKYKELLREAVEETIGETESPEEELRQLFSAFC